MNPTIAQHRPENIGFAAFAFVVAELALLTVAIRQFQLESAAFLHLTLLACGGFVVHARLPLRFRLPFFVLLSLAGIVLVFGVTAGIWLIVVGMALIGICHLPVPFLARVALLIAVGAALVAQRGGWLSAPWSRAIWPILGSMFMFRLVVYLYDLHHETSPRSLWRTLGYFFLLPNVCFPLFPVVDYKTFRRDYYDQEAFRIYQTGVDWMVRGVIQLILYRVVYYYLTMAPTEVRSIGGLVQFLVANFLLYLRVSGQFHLVVGMLHLFGFRLPETHHRYLLASSFTDFWRRINIYWKDFMLKMFYYPAYFKLRRRGPTAALVMSTVLVFAATWLLHAYQWFWLRGSFLLTGPDVLFWSILAGFVVVNALYESKHGRQRTLRPSSPSLRTMASRGARTVGTFSVICILWSLWTAGSVAEWLSLWRGLRGWGDWAVLDPRPLWPLIAVGMVVAATGGRGRGDGQDGSRLFRGLSFARSTGATVVSIAVLAAVGIPALYRHLGPEAATFINSLRSGSLSRLDTARLERGYYEDLIQVDRLNSQLWEVYMNKPLDWLAVPEGHGLERFTGDLRQKELVPSFTSLTRYGSIRTNRWGMRDREYERVPTPGTHRVALLGASSVMGWGVSDGETFEALVEDRLNRELAGQPYARYEILNFAVPGYRPLQQLVVLEKKALDFAPQAVFYVAPGRELSQAVLALVESVRSGMEIPYDFLRATVQRAGIDRRTEETLAVKRLDPFRGVILSWLYERIVQECRRRAIVPVFVFLPQVNDGAWQEETGETLQRAEAAGFVAISLSDVYQKHDSQTLRVAQWDNHPNAAGHRLIADALYAAIRAKQQQIFAPPTKENAQTSTEDHGEGRTNPWMASTQR
jgi:D-alanyl-lipoteichoic acid acyltransferase DltB (MBOAT superfamily)